MIYAIQLPKGVEKLVWRLMMNMRHINKLWGADMDARMENKAVCQSGPEKHDSLK